MADMGLALYKRDGILYLLPVAYEYNDTKFVGFSDRGEAYRINKLTDEQKGFLKTINPKEHPKTKNKTFIGDYYLYKVPFENFPKGKPYTQLPGGGGVYKITRQHTFIPDLFKEKVFLNALEKYAETISESMKDLKKIIKEEIDDIIYQKKMDKPDGLFFGMFDEDSTLKEKNPNVLFSAVAIENESDRSKLDEIYLFLRENKIIPDGFKKPKIGGKADYHMTIKTGELPESRKRDSGKEVKLNIVSLGVSDKAIALGVSGDYFSDREKQHITLAFQHYPVDSNDIEIWHPLQKPFSVKGIIREYDINKNVIKRGVFYDDSMEEANQIQIGNFPNHGANAGSSRSFPQIEEN